MNLKENYTNDLETEVVQYLGAGNKEALYGERLILLQETFLCSINNKLALQPASSYLKIKVKNL